MTNALELVREFHETYDCRISDVPTLDVPEKELRLNLIVEEVHELRDAIREDDLVETFDALLDIIWVTYGALLTFGLDKNADGDIEPTQPLTPQELIAELVYECHRLDTALMVFEDINHVYSSLLRILELCYGAILTFGLPFEQGIEEVARSNRSKLGLDGKPIYRESDRKVLKGPNYSPPDLKRILHAAQIDSGGSR